MKELIYRLLQKKKPSLNQNEPNPSPNLLGSHFRSTNIVDANQSTVINSLIYLNMILLVFFMLVIVMNSIMNVKLSALQDRLGRLELSILSKQDIYNKSRILSDKINIYKQQSTNRVLLSSKYNKIMATVPQNVNVSRLDFRAENGGFVSLAVDTDNVLKIALLITELAKTDIVNQLVLTSASIDSNSSEVEAALELYLK